MAFTAESTQQIIAQMMQMQESANAAQQAHMNNMMQVFTDAIKTAMGPRQNSNQRLCDTRCFTICQHLTEAPESSMIGREGSGAMLAVGLSCSSR